MRYTIINAVPDEFRKMNVLRIQRIMDKYPWVEVSDIDFVDGRANGEEWLKENGIEMGAVSLGEMGAFASTIQCLKWLVDSDFDRLLVFENDAIIRPDFIPLYNRYLSGVPEDFHAFSLCAARRDDEIYRRNPDSYDIGDELVCRAYQNWPSNAILYSRAGAEKALEKFYSDAVIDCTVDVWMYERSGLDIYTPKPDACRIVGRYLGASTADLSWKGWSGPGVEW